MEDSFAKVLRCVTQKDLTQETSYLGLEIAKFSKFVLSSFSQ